VPQHSRRDNLRGTVALPQAELSFRAAGGSEHAWPGDVLLTCQNANSSGSWLARAIDLYFAQSAHAQPPSRMTVR
jgi:hypothetical protein